MKTIRNRTLTLLLTALFVVSGACSTGSAPDTVTGSAASEESLTAVLTSNEDIAAAKSALYDEYIRSIADRKDELSSGSLTINGITQKIGFKKIGKPDEKGYPLYIGLRGGGNGNMVLAEQQFKIMLNQYYSNSIDHGIYVVPLCVKASFDEHYRPESFEFYDRIIEDAIAFYNVDPDRIYLLGFSSGGDGVYSVSPRIADRFAAVNMSAGFPNELRVENMADLPICIQMGAYDTPYNRNLMAADYSAMLESAGAEYGIEYTFETFIHRYGTHNERWSDLIRTYQEVYTGNEVSIWRNNPDEARTTFRNTCAVDWVSRYTRDPLPETVIWHTDVSASLRRSQAFYWLDRDGGLDHSIFKVSYSRDKNLVNIEKSDTESGTLRIYLCPEMLDVFADVDIVTPDGAFTVRPVISEDMMRHTLYARGDINYVFTSAIDVTFADGKAVSAAAAEDPEISYAPPADRQPYRWGKGSIFYVDNRLFGLSFDELCSAIGAELPKPESFRAAGYFNCKKTSLDVSGSCRVSFFFQDGKCMIIRSEQDYDDIPIGYADELKDKTGTFMNGTECVYSAEDDTSDGKHHISQEYWWYKRR